LLRLIICNLPDLPGDDIAFGGAYDDHIEGNEVKLVLPAALSIWCLPEHGASLADSFFLTKGADLILGDFGAYDGTVPYPKCTSYISFHAFAGSDTIHGMTTRILFVCMCVSHPQNADNLLVAPLLIVSFRLQEETATTSFSDRSMRMKFGAMQDKMI